MPKEMGRERKGKKRMRIRDAVVEIDNLKTKNEEKALLVVRVFAGSAPT